MMLRITTSTRVNVAAASSKTSFSVDMTSSRTRTRTDIDDLQTEKITRMVGHLLLILKQNKMLLISSGNSLSRVVESVSKFVVKTVIDPIPQNSLSLKTRFPFP